jgi:peroxiredoxin (alkyl hydroperoxide reductase subunit C)
MAIVGKKFPNITVDAISFMGDNLRINILEEATKNKKKVVLFWYPKDFTFVCPTELHAFQAALQDFEKRNTMVIGASCDTNEVHFAWLNTPKNNGGIEGVTYPILADTTRNLSAALDILDAEWVYDASTESWYQEKLHESRKRMNKMRMDEIEENKFGIYESFIKSLSSKTNLV